MAQDHDVVVPRELVVRHEVAAQRRLVSDEREEPGRHLHSAQLLRLAALRKLQVVPEVGGEPFEGPELRAVIAEISRRDREVWRRHRLLEKADEPIGFGVGQGRDQNPLHRAEDRGIRANRQRERCDRSEREARGSEEEPDGVANVLEQGVHHPETGWTDRTLEWF